MLGIARSGFPLISTLRRQRKVGRSRWVCKASLVYTVSSRTESPVLNKQTYCIFWGHPVLQSKTLSWKKKKKTKKKENQARCRIPLIPALQRQRQVDLWVQDQPGLQSEFPGQPGLHREIHVYNVFQSDHFPFLPGMHDLPVSLTGYRGPRQSMNEAQHTCRWQNQVEVSQGWTPGLRLWYQLF